LEAAPDAPPDAEPQPEASPPPEPAPPGPVILFDGVCNLCSAAVQWVIAHDRRNVFRFASLQSQAARKLLAAAGSSAGERLDSMVLLDQDGVHLRSEAALRIARGLGFPWSLARIGGLLPRSLRDALYDWVARHRYRWFGRQNACLLPTP
jgi:predicted DCC family thiol-disulfide oxidoreductase YuxK